MSKENQIEEMAKDLCGWCRNGICTVDMKPCDLGCSHRDVATILYNAGYRKQSEIAREIFEEIDNLFDKYPTLRNIGGTAIAELKKKYTEEYK